MSNKIFNIDKYEKFIVALQINEEPLKNNTTLVVFNISDFVFLPNSTCCKLHHNFLRQ